MNWNWMNELPQHLKDAPLMSLAIPGSHDSCAFNLNKNGPLAPDESKYFEPFKGVVYNWSITQELPIMDQLNIGIRYFDLRIAPKPDSEDLYFVHGLYGPAVQSVLENINQFLNYHPSEVVILDFNHLLEFKDEACHRKLIGMITSIFAGKLCPRQPTLANVTLTNLNNKSQQVIALYKYPVPNNLLWNQLYIKSPWLNKQNSTEVIKLLKENIKNKPSDVLYVSQGILTPDTMTIVGGLCSNLLNWEAGLNHKVMTWLDSKPDVNIIIIDDCNQEFADKVIAINK
nr:PI-PLC X domain-containing protein 2-like [Ciona intestinalis]|eukprot:XP_002119581.1 PI-PLC X domain-containing protein 2-like [Ciona intestinalis]